MCRLNKVTILVATVFITALMVFSSCRGRGSNPAVTNTATPPPTPPIDQTQVIANEPQNAYRQYAPGLLARTVYKAEPTGRFAVEAWDLLVGPGQKTESVTLPGAAVFEIRSGSGNMLVGGAPREVQIGATFAIDEGQSFQIENKVPDSPLAIRVVLIHSP